MRNASPKIMSVVWYKVLPAHFGGQKGIANFNEALGKHIPLVCICSRNNEPGSAKHYQVFNLLPKSKWQILNPLAWFIIIRFAVRHKITHVILEHPYHVIAAIFLKLSGKTIITHSHNIEFERFKQTGKKGWKWIYFIEKITYKISDLILFKTPADLRIAINVFLVDESKTMLMPYGISQKSTDTKANAKRIVQTRHNITSVNKILLFNGTLDYAPNAEAVVNIAKHLIPHLRKAGLQFTILITGRLEDESYAYLRNVKARDFIFAGLVEDVEKYFLAADVYINAVDEGGGVQTKTLEALSYGVPVVMFKTISQGIDVDEARPLLYLVEKYHWRYFAEVTKLAADQTHEHLSNRFFNTYSFDANLQPLIAFIKNTAN